MTHTSVFFAFGSPAQCRIETRDVGDGAHACRHGLRRDPRGTARPARALPARKAPRSARSAPACPRLAPRPGIAIGDGSRPARSRVLSPATRAASAPPRLARLPRLARPSSPLVCPRRAHVGGARPSRRTSTARAPPRAADDAASIAEREHEAFLMANKLLLDARAARAETRAPPLCARRRWPRARAPRRGRRALRRGRARAGARRGAVRVVRVRRRSAAQTPRRWRAPKAR